MPLLRRPRLRRIIGLFAVSLLILLVVLFALWPKESEWRWGEIFSFVSNNLPFMIFYFLFGVIVLASGIHLFVAASRNEPIERLVTWALVALTSSSILFRNWASALAAAAIAAVLILSKRRSGERMSSDQGHSKD